MAEGLPAGQRCISVLADIDAEAPGVLEAAEGRTQADAEPLREELPGSQRAKVEAAAIDTSAAYAAAVRARLPSAEIVHDRFHVSKLVGEAVDKVRRGEARDLLAKGNDRLLRTRYLWLWHPDQLTGTKLEAFKAVALQNLRTARACYHRLMFPEFWEPLGPDLVGERPHPGGSSVQFCHRAIR